MSDEYQPWVWYPHIWKTESAWLSFIRGGIRRHLWSKNPIKLEFIKEKRIQIPNTNARSAKRFPTVSGGRCEQCGGVFREKDMEVDHKTGEHSLKSVQDVQKFVEGIVFVRKEDLAYLCKPCHKIKTHAERYEMSLEHAEIEKIVIQMVKDKTLKSWLEGKNIKPESTAAKRRVQVVNKMREDLESEG